MTRPQSAAMMDAVFGGEDEDAKGRLLKIMQGFLVSESEKHSALQKGQFIHVSLSLALRAECSHQARPPRRLKLLIWKNWLGTQTVSRSLGMSQRRGDEQIDWLSLPFCSVSSAVVQRYLPQILEAALSSQMRIQAVAVDILGFTVKQGLAHPLQVRQLFFYPLLCLTFGLQCMPVIVALETSASAQLSARAHALHSILNSKHASLVNSRYMECARTSFDYQSRLRKDDVQGQLTKRPPLLRY